MNTPASRAADRERTAVYAAELAAFDGTDLEREVEFDTVAAAIRAVVETRWWPGGDVVVQRARTTATSSSTRCVVADTSLRDVRIRLARGQWTVATAAHELAHVLAGPTRGHDATFRAAYLDVVAVITNVDASSRRRDLHVEQLRRAFQAAGLAVGARTWPPPPADVAGAIAL